MASDSDFRKRLQSLAERRRVPSDLVSASRHIAKADGWGIPTPIAEAYQKRTSKEFTSYTLGCMEELPPRSTEISIEEGVKVRDQLTRQLGNQGLYPSFEFQGSVPLNIHIEYASDIDLLVLASDILTYSTNGPKASQYTPSSRTVLATVQDLRARCEQILTNTYYASKVDCGGAKSIALSEGSFRRKVDVVPSAWYDTVEYQTTGLKSDRSVQILDKSIPELITNMPFKHINFINQKDANTFGGCKKTIRLLKSLKRDSAIGIQLSSYEIAGLIWNMDNSSLQYHPGLDLLLLGNTFTFLCYLCSNITNLKKLRTPDDSRYLIDTDEKVSSVSALRNEVELLATKVASENDIVHGYQEHSIGSLLRTISLPVG